MADVKLEVMSSEETMTSGDLDDESILSLIFKDKFSDEQRNSHEFLLYLSRLLSFNVHKLNLEPSRLENEKSRILDLTQELAFQNYKTFIKTAKCSKDIFKDFGAIENHLQSLVDKVPLLSQHTQSFVKEAKSISATRSSNSITLTRHTELLEILEISQLMDTCVRNQYYEDALQLMLYVKRLSKNKTVADIPLMASVIKDVQRSSQLMLEQLLAQLRTESQLPGCLRVIGFLRRLLCFTETELRLRFLQARNAWLENVLSGIAVREGENEAYERINRIIEVTRVHVFDIVTQYRSIFSDDSTAIYSEQFGKHADNSPYKASILHCWLTYRIDLFLEQLRHCLAKGVGNRVDLILRQCMFFGRTLSRVGAEFRPLLIPIFREAVSASFDRVVRDATKEFEMEMVAFSLQNSAISHSQAIGSGDVLSASANSSREGPEPPRSLLDFPPLAVYVNGILSGFNQMSNCAPMSLATSLPGTLQASIKRAANIILAFYYAEEPAFNSSERAAFLRFCAAFLDVVLPHLETCAKLLLPRQQITTMYGDLNLPWQHSDSSVIDTAEIYAILKPCLPKSADEAVPNDVVAEGVIGDSVKPLHSSSPDPIDNSAATAENAAAQ